MKKVKLSKTKAETIYIKKRGIPKGCQYCLEGSKVVLFLNGICQNPENCWWYCPISQERKGKELTFADEIQIKSKDELIEEIEKINAKGMSITGGDPLFTSNLEKTMEYIRYVKAKKGKSFHIHLYTNGQNFDESIAKQLSQAGLDEIRFHPANDNWQVINNALNKGMSVGIEVPMIPEKSYSDSLEKLIIYFDSIGGNFVNINELEYCFPNSEHLKKRGFNLEKGTIASVKDSIQQALELIERVAPKVSVKIHFCPIIAKDYWQLKERYRRRATSIKHPFEYINEEGLLMFGQIEGAKNSIQEFKKFIQEQYQIPEEYMELKDNLLKIPLSQALNEDFSYYLEQYELNGFIIEMTPFREEKYCQITEKTPINVFKEEYEYHVG